MTKKEFDKYVREQIAPKHESELEIIVADPDTLRSNLETVTLPVLSIEADKDYQD